MIKTVLDVFTSTGLRDLFAEILEHKCDPSVKPVLLPEAVLRPRKTHPKCSMSMLAFIPHAKNGITECIDIEYYNDRTREWNSWSKLNISLKRRVLYIIRWRKAFFLFREYGETMFIDNLRSNPMLIKNMPIIVQDFAALIHDNFIYICGGSTFYLSQMATVQR